MAHSEFPLPDVGEGLTEAEIVSWKVKPGDTVTVNQVLVEIETAKSLVELPSPFAGTVTELLFEEGATVEVGAPIIRVDSAGGTIELQAPRGGDTVGEVGDPKASAAAEEAAEAEKPGAVLVGYGSKGGHATTRRRRPGAVLAAAEGTTADGAKASARRPGSSLDGSGLGHADHREAADPQARERPRCRHRDGDRNRGRRRDRARRRRARGDAGDACSATSRPRRGPQEREERIPVKGVRKAIATAMVSSAFTAPHVSVFTDVNATRTMEFVKRLKDSTDFAGIRISPLLVMAKAVIWAVRRNPTVNSTWADKEIVVHHYVNLGIAAATPRGLIVPNIKDAQDLSLRELAQALEQLTITARDGKTSPAEMSNGTITITNLGSYGMDTGTPILNPGEVGIVALGAIKQKPWVVDGEVRPALRHDGVGRVRPPRRRRRCREPVHRRPRGRHRGARAPARLTALVRTVLTTVLNKV